MTTTDFSALLAGFKPTPAKPNVAGEGERGGTRVVVRIRPTEGDDADPQAVFGRESGPAGEAGAAAAASTATTVDVHEVRKSVRGDVALQTATFSLDAVYGASATTEELYAAQIAPLVPWAWNGGVATVFAYGQTGSGKTFTIAAIERLVAHDLFDGVGEGKRNVFLTVVELAGNVACDLINSRRAVSILEDQFGTTQLNGAIEAAITTEAEMIALIETATAQRRTAATEKNAASSRSHAIARLRIQNLDSPEAEDGVLFLIDLAGSEAARDSAQHDAARMRETRDINASLAVLKDCIRGKAEADAHAAAGVRANRRAHVPFRQAALTKVLKHIFDPAATTSGRTVVVACVNPLLGDAAPTRNTLRYAETLRVLVPRMGAPKYNAKAPSTWSNAHVRAWLETESGSPAVDAELLAPTETGLQLLRLPAPEFEARCARTPGVNSQQAAAVRTKFWAMHVDSRATAAPKVGELEPGTGGRAELETMFSQNGSRVADDRPWNQRLRPGMVVAWTPPPMSRYRWSSDFNIVLLLAPTTVATGLIDPLAQPIEPAEGRWLCASITPAELPTAYNVNIWRQIPVDVETMNREVFLEYDPATRFYYVAV